MRCLFCALVLVGSLFAVEEPASLAFWPAQGWVFLDGFACHDASRAEDTVVSATHSVINREFLALQPRVDQTARQSVAIEPENAVVEDAVAGRALPSLSGSDLANRIRRPYSWARYSVSPIAGSSEDSVAIRTVSPASIEMMREMAARTYGLRGPSSRMGAALLYTDAPGVLAADSHP